MGREEEGGGREQGAGSPPKTQQKKVFQFFIYGKLELVGNGSLKHIWKIHPWF